MNIDKHIKTLNSDKRIKDHHIKNTVTALYLNESIKEDEKQLRKLLNSKRNLNGCILTSKIIEEILADIKTKKQELYSLPDYVPVICKDVLKVKIISKPVKRNDVYLYGYL